MRLTVRSIGLMLMVLGAWGAIVPFVGPEFDYPFPAGSDRDSWDWTASTWQLSLLPGIFAAYGGVILLGLVGTVRFAPAFGALIALAAGAWFVLGDEFSRLWTSPPPEGSGSDWMVIATNLGYHEGLGLTISALSAFALGMLALLPERTAPQPVAIPQPVPEESTHEYAEEPVAS